MPIFSGSLNRNEVQNALFNMIISQSVWADNIKGTYALVDKARVDGGRLGDTKLFLDTDILKSYEWSGDSEASNLLALDRPPAPKTQAITINKFRQVRCTVDEYLSPRAFSTEYVFSDYNGVLLGWIRETKRVYDSRLYNSFLGSHETSVGRQQVSVPISAARGNASSEEEANRLEAGALAKVMADLIVDLQDTTRDFNDYGFMRSHSDEEITVVWASGHVSKIKYLDLPTMFHKEGLIKKFEQEVLPSRYFTKLITSSNISDFSASTPAAGKPIDSDDHTYVPGSNHANGLIRSMVEKTVTVSAVEYHVLPGDEIPAGATIVASTGDFLPGEVGIEDSSIICKIFTKYPSLMSGFEVGSSFWNARSLTTNHYLTFSFNELDHYYGKPFITVRAA